MSEGFTVAIIGGGFAGSAVAFQLARLATPNLRILVFEPRPALGGGLAYSTVEPVHRVNVVAQRMSLVPDEPLDFAHWFAAAGGDDPEAVLPDGRVFPRRAAFGRYVSEREPDLASGQISHIRAKVGQLSRAARGWLVQSDRHPEVQADAVVLALGNPPPVAPVSLARGLAGAAGFIADPHKAGALEAIGKGDRVLVVGAGLTMADIVAALDRAGHCGAIHAISRRGQRSRGHAKEVIRPAETVMHPQARTALGLLGGVREALRLAQRRGEDWHVVFDAVAVHPRHLEGAAACRAAAALAPSAPLLGGAPPPHRAAVGSGAGPARGGGAFFDGSGVHRLRAQKFCRACGDAEAAARWRVA